MAEKAGAIASSRIATLEHINRAVAASNLSFPKPHVAVNGEVERMLMEGASALAAEERFFEMLASQRRQDATAGRALSGTHRSEFLVTHREKNMPAHLCSTGEQKALLLSIILAQARASAHSRGVVPLILLDEVVAHLDPARRLELFDETTASGAQAWMSGTDASLFEGMRGRGQFFEVKNGHIAPQK